MTKKTIHKSRNRLWIILAGALLLRLGLLVVGRQNGSGFMTPDSGDYLLLADSLINSWSFTHNTAAEIFRIPGYPLFLALIKFSGGGLLTIIVAQAMLGTLNCWLTWRLTKINFKSSMTAILAALFQAGAVVAIVFNNKVLSETLFTTFLLSGLLFISRLTHQSDQPKNRKYYWLKASVSGSLIALACLCRAIILPLLPLFFTYIWWRSRNFKLAALFILPIIMIVLGWSVRNYHEAKFAGYSSVGAINLYRYNGCALLAAQHKRSFTLQQQLCDRELDKYSSQTARANFAQTQGEKIILSAPLRYSFIHLKSDINNLLPAVGDLFRIAGADIGGNGTLAVINSSGIISGVKHYFKGKWWLIFVALPLVLWLIYSYLTAAVAVFSLLTDKSYRHLMPTIIFYLIIIAWFLLIPGPASHPRFRVPITPLLSMLAAWGSMVIMHKIRNFISNRH